MSDLDEMANDFLSEMPKLDVDRASSLLEENKQEYSTNQGTTLKETFDPDIHAVDSDGNPKKNKDGSYSKKRGRRKGQTVETSNNGHVEDHDKVFQFLGQQTAEVIFTVSVMAFGEDWQPIKNDEFGINERRDISKAWADYYKTTGIVQIPAWIGVAIVMTSYAGIRLRSKQTRSRLGLYWDKFKTGILHLRNKRNERKNRDVS